MEFEIILARDSQNGIGYSSYPLVHSAVHKQCVPWNIPEEMEFFRQKTLEINLEIKNSHINVIIMGRLTADLFTLPLKNRINVVITSMNSYRCEEGFVSYTSLDNALDDLRDRIFDNRQVNKVFVIGGAKLADHAIKHRKCRRAYITDINCNYLCDIKLTNDFVDILNNYDKIIGNCVTVSHTSFNCDHVDVVTFNTYHYVNTEERNYLNILSKIIKHGDYRQTRNAKTYSIFGEKLEFDLANGFPLLTTKKVFYRGIFEELLFFLRGETNTKLLEDKKVMIWHDNTTPGFLQDNNKNLQEFDMGPMYGFQWRHFGAHYNGVNCRDTGSYNNQGVDQLKNLIELIVKDPYSRRMMLTTYNPGQAEEGVLYPCHGIVVQFYVEKNNRLSLQMYQRSSDIVLGVPFNIASYAALLYIIINLVNNHENRVHEINYVPGRVIMIFGDTHIYSDEKGDHIEAAKTQISRMSNTYPFPQFRLNKQLKTLKELDTLEPSDMEIIDYVSNSAVKAKMIA